MNNIRIVYTMWDNLKKTGDMDVGQVGFKKDQDVRYITVEKKINEIVNRLEKTRVGNHRYKKKCITQLIYIKQMFRKNNRL